MHRFTRLYLELDRTTRTSEKTAALQRYFEEAPHEDAAWALAVLTGRKLIRAVSYARLRQWAAQRAGLPDWLLAECHSSVGDLSETLTLIIPPATKPKPDQPLHEVIEQRILPLAHMTESQQRDAILDAWDTFDGHERFLFHKLISANFRVGVARKLVSNALACAARIDPAVMQHRLAGRYEPTTQAFSLLLQSETHNDTARPYPFFLATALEQHPTQTLGSPADWRAEWKWDGIRAQLIRRLGQSLLWSRGDELVTNAFPEIVHAAHALPDGTVLDGELLAWDPHQQRPLPFSDLQKRLNRKHVEPMLFDVNPVVFMAYDILEHAGHDLRDRSTDERYDRLQALLPPDDAVLRLSPRIAFQIWDDLAQQRECSRAKGVEGVMLKRASAPYAVGRTKGDWYKWKIDPYTVDCVMVYAQRGTGRRATLYTDYTFAVWTGPRSGEGTLVPVTKAYSGLTDEEFRKVDRFIRDHSTGKKGAFRAVEPVQVFEIAFEGINASDRHKSGIALRFPRMHRWRTDKTANEADTLDTLRSLMNQG